MVENNELREDLLVTILQKISKIEERMGQLEGLLRYKPTNVKVDELRKLVSERKRTNVGEVMDLFKISKPVALEIMRRASDGNGVMFLRGGPSNPSLLCTLDDGNKVEFAARTIISELKERGIGSTTGLDSIAKRWNLSREKEVRDVTKRIIQLTNARIKYDRTNSKPSWDLDWTQERLIFKG